MKVEIDVKTALEKQIILSDKSKKDVAEALEVTYTTVVNWCSGRTIIRLDQAEKLSKLLDCKLEDLIVA